MKNTCLQRLLFLTAAAAVIAACLPRASEESAARDTTLSVYDRETGALQLCLDRETGHGERYVRQVGEAGLWEFTYTFDLPEEARTGELPFFPEKGEVTSYLGTNGAELVTDYGMFWEYDAGGKPLRFCSRGNSGDPGLEDPVDVVRVEFIYREDGTLRRKDLWHNAFLMGTTGSTAEITYDELERPVFARCYITHGSLEYYYFYTGEAAQPDSCLCLDLDGDHCRAELYA